MSFGLSDLGSAVLGLCFWFGPSHSYLFIKNYNCECLVGPSHLDHFHQRNEFIMIFVFVSLIESPKQYRIALNLIRKINVSCSMKRAYCLSFQKKKLIRKWHFFTINIERSFHLYGWNEFNIEYVLTTLRLSNVRG
jgi:hypothetical protein